MLGVNTVIVVTKDDLKNTGCAIKDPIQRVYNKNLNYSNILLVIVERKTRKEG